MYCILVVMIVKNKTWLQPDSIINIQIRILRRQVKLAEVTSEIDYLHVAQYFSLAHLAQTVHPSKMTPSGSITFSLFNPNTSLQ